MYGKLSVSSWVAIREGCPISYEVLGSGTAHVLCGDPADAFEFEVDAEALRELVRLGAEALHEMDARYTREQAE